MNNIGKNLEPVQFGLNKSNKANTLPDQFGQINSSEKDVTIGSAPSAQESTNLHQQSDVDSSQRAQHHTLGKSRNQASPGNHIHDGITSPKMGAMAIGTSGNNPVPAFTLTGSKGGNVALANLITFLKLHFNFTDTTT